MADFKISGKNVITQAGTAEPVLASNVTLGTGIVKAANITDAATSTLSCTTDSTTTVATADSSSLSVGMAVSGTNIPANAHIVTIPNATSFTITSAATGGATSTLTFRTGITSAKIEDDAVTSAKVSGLVKGDVGLGNVDNTTDALKPVSTATTTALGLKADTTAVAAVSLVKPHIVPGKLYPAVEGKDVSGVAVNTSHGSTYTYGTTHADGRKYYYTSIKGSTNLNDPRIGSHFGGQRHIIRSSQYLHGVSAANGLSTYSYDGREWMRAVGGTTESALGSVGRVLNNARGVKIRMDATGGFVEVVGYFTDINVLHHLNSGYTFQYSLNGGSYSSNIGNTTLGNGPLEDRYESCPSVTNVGIGATLGINTVRIKTTGGNNLDIFGIEFITQDTGSTARRSQINIPAQNVVSYGKKFSIGSDTLTDSVHTHYDPFNGFVNDTTLFSAKVDVATSLGIGTQTTWGAAWDKGSDNHIRPYNGGRVVKWIASDGTIKTSVTMMPANAQCMDNGAHDEITTPSATNTTKTPNISDDAIDHSLAEIARTFHWREFGNGCANGLIAGTWKDASLIDGTAREFGFTMDDGLTSLSGKAKSINHAVHHTLWSIEAGEYVLIHFIGCGLSAQLTGWGTQKRATSQIIQNLPYGTHAVRILRSGGGIQINVNGVEVYNVSSGDGYRGWEFTIFQPTKPPIPEDACIIADYMLMADFVANNIADHHVHQSKGTRMVSCSRDVDYYGGSPNFALDYSSKGGFRIFDADRNQVPAFCTSFQLVGYAPRCKLQINGSDVTETNSGVNQSYGKIHLTNPVTLGINKIGSAKVSGQNGNFNTYHIATPTHTSHHYQPFETPYTYDLLGGDRNMEQTNLVVTADGKTWDQITRDTSYLGPKYIYTLLGTNGGSGDIQHMASKFRGAGGNGKHAANKGFIYAGSGEFFMIPKTGTYRFSANLRNDAGTERWFRIEKMVSGGSPAILFTTIESDNSNGDRSCAQITAEIWLDKHEVYKWYTNQSSKGQVQTEWFTVSFVERGV